MEIKTQLSTLWIVVMLNMVFADVLSIMVELVNKDTLSIPGDVKVMMAIAATVTNIPILMIYFSRTLPFKLNRMLNIGAGFFTILYIIGGGSLTPHYIIIACIEIMVLSVIIFKTWQWSDPSERKNLHTDE